MAKINNKEIYKLEELPDLLDFLIGSKEVGGTTKNFSLLSIVNLINGVNGKNGIQYLFSDGSDPTVDFNTPGYFFTDTNQTTVGSFSEFIFNKKNLANYDLTALFTFLGQRNDIVLKIENPSSPSDFFFFEIGGFEDHANYIIFYVTGYANLYLGQLEDFTAYSMYWDVQQDISVKADITYVNAQDGITLAAAKTYTDTQDLLKENTSNKTSTLSGKEGSNVWFPSANGITAWIKNFLSNWVGAHAAEIQDADTVLIGKSGVLGTRTWLQLKTLLLGSVDLSVELALKEDKSNKVSTITPSINQYPNNTAVINYVAANAPVSPDTNLANTDLTLTASRTHSLNSFKLWFTGGLTKVFGLELEVISTNAVANKIWNDGVDLWYTTALGVQKNLSNASAKLDKLIATAQSVVSQVTFLGKLIYNPVTAVTIKSALVLNPSNEIEQAGVVELLADDGSTSKYTSDAALDAAYPTAISGFELICTNISTTNFPNGVIYKKTASGWKVEKLYLLSDV